MILNNAQKSCSPVNVIIVITYTYDIVCTVCSTMYRHIYSIASPQVKKYVAQV